MLSIMHRADEAEAIASHVSAIGERLSASEKQGNKSEDMQGKLVSRLPGFVNALDAYLDVEVQCYDFLKSRCGRRTSVVAHGLLVEPCWHLPGQINSQNADMSVALLMHAAVPGARSWRPRWRR